MDYYDILGVSKEASPDELKKAYRKKARETHPDVNKDDPGAEDKFKQVNEAYNTLSDPEKRAAYDNPRIPGFNGNLEDFINSHFRAGPFGRNRRTSSRAPNQKEKGASVRASTTISLYESIVGADVSGTLEFVASCDECDGVGGEDFTQLCHDCGGTGNHELQQGAFSMRQTCRTCTGTGLLPAKPCPACEGSTKRKYFREYTVSIPSGFSGGHTILEGFGAPGLFGGESGDVQLEISIRLPKIDVDALSDEERRILRKYLC